MSDSGRVIGQERERQYCEVLGFAEELIADLNKPEGFERDIPRCYEHAVRALLRSREGTPLAHTYTFGGCGIEGGPMVLQVYRRPKPEEMPCR